MTFRNPLGSISALSLAANPAALPVIATAAGVAVTVAAATYTYKAYKQYEEKKHREAIEAINHLHEKHLARIFIPDNHEIKGFPPIFKLDPDKPSSTVDSMHFTDDQVEDIGKSMPRCTDIILSNYRESVLNAMLKLKEYYFSRDDHKDITAGVISYLLYILESKCLNFEGYDYDIAYLDAITNFINAYASMQDRENTQHFSRLNPVYAYLLTAQQELERHRDALSLEGMVTELREACISHTSQLVRSFAKLVVKEKDWNLVKMVTMDELTQGLLRRKYIHSEIKGLVLRSDSEKHVPDSPFKNWVISLANYYLHTLDPDTRLGCGEVIPPDRLFVLPELQRLEYLRGASLKFNSDESKELRLLEEQMESIRTQFRKCKNFITTRLDARTINTTPKFIPVDTDADLYNRSKILAQFAALIHQTISIQYLSTHLLKSIKQLGEIYVKNPLHFSRIFNVLGLLCKQVKNSVDAVKESFTRIQKMNRNAMQLEDQELFPEQIKAILDSTYAIISRLDKRIKEYRDRVPKNKQEPTVESVKHEMFEVAGLLAQIYHMQPEAVRNSEQNILPFMKTAAIVQGKKAAFPARHAADAQCKPTETPGIDGQAIAADAAPVLSSSARKPSQSAQAPLVTDADIDRELMRIERHLQADFSSGQRADSGQAMEKSAPITRLAKVNLILREISNRILEIQRMEAPQESQSTARQEFNAEISAYTQLCDSLKSMREYFSFKLNEDHAAEDERIQIDRKLDAMLDMGERVLAFLKLQKSQRVAQARMMPAVMEMPLRELGGLSWHVQDASSTRPSQSVADVSIFARDSHRPLLSPKAACELIAAVLGGDQSNPAPSAL
ncbi:hypothetical protein AQUSIP_09750 [Aquicella siphonis]|uniref:Transmembrane protein n=1 Tax=Aquicella siphonis TaxID=254247 RepID=A0A5E4PGC3_9COXI|nr:hypothetical protein [Aquicella siphonis]VVC75685.1 hypothetical protein AQUSIP_09750 [Aquicella siphonis]